MQSVCSVLFLAMCILACFTAFWRDGSIEVSTLSSALMALFFVLFGVNAGVFTGSYLLEKPRQFCLWASSAVACAMTLLMYIGEMCLLNGKIYRLGTGLLFEGLPGIALAPVDIVIVAAAGGITAALLGKALRASER